MTTQRDVLVLSCPSEEDTEDTENIIVERHWDGQLQYLISISGRSFYVGGTIPVSFTMLPLAKVRIHRISVILEGEFLTLHDTFNFTDIYDAYRKSGIPQQFQICWAY